VRELVFQRQFLAGVGRDPAKPAVTDGCWQATHGEHLERVARACSALRHLGLGAGDRFAVLAGTGHEFLELWHAALCGAAVINPLNTRLAPPELAYILADSATEVLFVGPEFVDLAGRLRELVHGVRTIVTFGPPADRPGGVAAGTDLRYEDLLAVAAPQIPPEPEEDDPAILMYTGGTTGRPKGVVLSHRNVALNSYHMTMSFRLDESLRYLTFMPMFHVSGALGILGPFTSGGSLVLLGGFEAEAVMAAVEQHAITDTGFVPTMLALILQDPGFRPERFASLRTVGYGAAPMTEGLLARIMELYPDLGIFQGYGMTEACGVITFLSPEDHRRGGPRLRSVGRAMGGVQFSIRDPDDVELAVGEVGEVCVRTGTIMERYWNQPEATAEALRGGWYHSGDVGYLDEAGYLYLVDRVKDMIVTGGENVYSIEVESALSTFPGVRQVAVIGVPHEIWGEAVHAIVVVDDPSTVTSDELQGHVRSQLAGYKVPKTVELRREPLPLSAAGKVVKRELRQSHQTAPG